MRKNCLAAAIGAGLAMSPGTAAWAQQAGADMPAAKVPAATEAATTLDALTVTARRRAESVQDVPVAVSAFGADQLEDLQADNLSGLQGAVPNLNVAQGRGSASSANVFIRGIGQPDALPSFDPGVGIYVDDVYYSRIQGALFNLFDIERIEVLRGPQGTLYGKNSTGGAIKLVTREPGDSTTGMVEAAFGDHGRADFRGYAATPLSDTVGVSAALISSHNDGYVRDDSGRHYNDDSTGAGRVKLSLRPGDAFTATLAVDYTRQNNALTLGNPEAPLFRVDLATGGSDLLFVPSSGDYDFVSNTSIDAGRGQHLVHQGISATLSYALNEAWLLKSISAYRDLDLAYYIDIDASPFRLGDTYATLDQDQLSQELQLQYDNGRNIRAVYGLYWLQEEYDGHQDVVSDDVLRFGPMPVAYRTLSDDRQKATSSAAFGQVSWEFIPGWTLGAGLRYSHERKDYRRVNAAITSLPPLDSRFSFTGSRSWTAWTPSLSLSKAFGDNVMAYASANRGFKSGGFNGRASRDAETRPFDPEYVWTYELGLKSTSRNGRLRGNITAFHSDYRDFQARVADVADPGSPVPSFVFPVLNAAEMSIDGVELEGTALLGEGTRLSAQVGWMDARYESFDDPRTVLDPNLANLHDHVPFSPRWTAQLALSQSFGLGNGSTLTVGGDVSYRDDTWLSVDNRATLRQPAYTLVGLFASWDSADLRWQLRAGVRNLTDEVYKTDAQEFSSVANVQTAYYGWPRNYSVSLRYSF
ncbi:TonB-dependent receptor [Marilutibacter chinensis]|uniref:TonB-dependent receptor n=1 Tax=Marilutibacter chinensis TaxID=2912247 RepID=A0ABS9HP67_9GAMM|nr:TonB-dependent receptor [Lysobacter chinensis]MCF7220771.1 TonB-dependent receptor [Lysobacter chinensis]